MIKWDGFLKLLKQGFFILLISCFILLGGSFASAVKIEKNGQFVVSSLDNSINIQVNNKGQLMASRLGYTKRILAFISDDTHKIFFWFGPGKLPYSVVQWPGRDSSQGFYKYYFLCDELTSGSTSIMQNCSTFDISNDFSNEMGGFFQSITINDYWGYDVYAWNCYAGSPQVINKICFSSSEFHKSLCLSNGIGSVGAGCSCDNCYQTSGSLGIDLSKQFTAIPDSYIETPPGFSYQGETNGSVEVNTDSVYTGDYTYKECTNGSVINYAENMGITSYLCQGGLDNWDLLSMTGIYNPIPGSGKWLDEIYGYTNDSQTAKQWFDYWNTSFNNQYVSSQEIRYSKPAVLRSYFKFYNEYGGNNFDFNTVYEYCLLKKFYSWDNSFAENKYNGTYFKQTCDFINNGGWDNGVSSNGESVVGLNWNGVGNLTGGKTYSDPGVFITDMFTHLKSYVPTSFSDIGGGFLPVYIISFMLFLIVFRFLSH